MRFQIVRLVKVHGIDFIHFHEILNVDGLGSLQVNALKILVFQHDVLALFVLVTFNNLVPRHFSPILFRDTFIANGTKVRRPQEPEPEFFSFGRRVKGDGDID